MAEDLFRIGRKLVSREKIMTALDTILHERASGATQREAAHTADVPRTFISNLETLGELRSGSRVAIIAFPIDNGPGLRELADYYGVEFTLAFSQAEREHTGSEHPAELFNRTLDTIAALQDFDTVIVLASDRRIETIRRIIDAELIGICLGESPLNNDQHADLDELGAILAGLGHQGEDVAGDSDAADSAGAAAAGAGTLRPGGSGRRRHRMRQQGRRTLSGVTQLVREWDKSKK
ncbi:MAG: transcriptional regulator [Coriobacteriia bacterium]|nr:transcriptional regulator [Coriobacteriia bacterium]